MSTYSTVSGSSIMLPSPVSHFENWQLAVTVGGPASCKRALIADLQDVIARYHADGVTHNEILAPVAAPAIANGMKCPNCHDGVYRAYKARDVGTAGVRLTYWCCTIPGTRRRNADCKAPNPEPTFEQPRNMYCANSTQD